MLVDYFKCRKCKCLFKVAFNNEKMNACVCPVCEENDIDYATDEEIDLLEDI